MPESVHRRYERHYRDELYEIARATPPMTAPLRICLWSGPRNVSTALMYAFGQRTDTRIVDEPLYAHYLRCTGAQHPAREAILAAQDPDGERVVRDLILGPCELPVLFLKQMTQHLVELDEGFLEHTANVLLIRDPARVLTSFAKVVPRPRAADVGIQAQLKLLQGLRERGQDPAVLDSRLLLEDPRGILERLCMHLGLSFDERMLQWEPGPRAEDGIWAPHWYASTHRSRGFAAYRPATSPVPPELYEALEACRPAYQTLLDAAQAFASSRSHSA